MATILSDQIDKPIPGPGASGDLKVLFGSHTFAVAASDADVVRMFRIPQGFTPMFGWLVGADIDTGTEELELDVGVTGDTTKFLNSGVITGDTIANEKITVGIKIPLQEDLMTVKPTEITSETDCIVTVTAAAQAGGTGVITVYLCGVVQDTRIL
ncbi:MAG: hypothetical protein O7D95_02850 [Betaproteobacteria bacterium]|nr:hypothetical protein [Betaproteobacteria bacterium]